MADRERGDARVATTGRSTYDPCVRRPRKTSLRSGLALAAILTTGCHCKPPPPLHPTTAAILQAAASGLTPPVTDALLKSVVVPPFGWKPDPVKQTDKHRHQVWLSPTGQTAYGVIYFDLPLPVGVDLALWGFLKEMKNTEGEANLLSKKPDETLPGLRFAAEGGLYTVRCKLKVDGFHGWIVYAGTLRSKPVNQTELKNGRTRPRSNTRGFALISDVFFIGVPEGPSLAR